MKKNAILLKFLVYWLLTQEERLRYSVGCMRGMHCVGRRDRGMLPGSDVEYLFDPKREPEREYLTWKEFKRAHTHETNEHHD